MNAGLNNEETIIDRIIGYSQAHGNLFSKFSEQFCLSAMEPHLLIEARNMAEPSEEALSVSDFVRLFLLLIKHKQDETLYLAMTLKGLFQKILSATNSSKTIRFSDFTGYLCEKISNNDMDIVVPTKKIALEKHKPDMSRIREIDLQPPIVEHRVEKEFPKLSKDLKKLTRKLKHNLVVSQLIHAPNTKRIFVLGSLSSQICIYDQQLKLCKVIIPSECKLLGKQVAILSIAYNKKSDRLGAIVRNFGVLFWEGSDDYATEKSMVKTSGDKIYYLQLCDSWMTTNRDTIFFWDIRQERATRVLHRDDSEFISDLCQINHLRSLCVSYTLSTGRKLLVIYHDFKVVSRIELDRAGCHTLHYNNLTQCLLVLSYNSVIQVYRIESGLFDVDLLSQLRGHKSIVTCIDSVATSSLVVTGDDIGEVRIWELNYMRCLQVVSIAKSFRSLAFIGDRLLFSDGRINILQLDHQGSCKTEHLSGLYQHIDELQGLLWIVTSKDIRKLQLASGRTLTILVVCKDDEDITAATRISGGTVVGYSKGKLSSYSDEGNLLWTCEMHEGEICTVRFDSAHRFIFTLGVDRQIYLIEEKAPLQEHHLKHIVYNENISLMEISQKHCYLLLGSPDCKQVHVWDYDVVKLHKVIQLPEVPNFLLIEDALDLACLATVASRVYALQINKAKGGFTYQVVAVLLLNQLVALPAIQPNVMTSISVIVRVGETHQLLVATTQGKVHAYSLTGLAVSQPKCNEGEFESVNMLRNSKQEYRNSLKSCSVSGIHELEVANVKQFELSWVRWLHKDVIKSLQQFEMNGRYVSTLCTDGYCKIIKATNGDIVCSNDINLPLPIQWRLSLLPRSSLHRHIRETLSLLSDILEHSRHLAEEERLLNVAPFLHLLDELKNCLQCPPVKVGTLHDELTPEDIHSSCVKSPTLQELQAYKRVKLMKQANNRQLQLPYLEPKANNLFLEKEHLVNLLSPTYLPEVETKGLLLGSRLVELLNWSIQKPRKSLHLISQLRGETMEVRARKENAPVGQGVTLTRMKLPQQPVKQIISEINSKLRNYKQGRYGSRCSVL